MADCKSPDACHHCHGTGAVYLEAIGLGYSHYATCDACSGTGRRLIDFNGPSQVRWYYDAGRAFDDAVRELNKPAEQTGEAGTV